MFERGLIEESNALFDQRDGTVDGKGVVINNHFEGFPILQSACQLCLAPSC